MNILVAVRQKEAPEIISALEGVGEIVFAIQALSKLDQNLIANINLALIDEDFDGLQTGWVLASEIRGIAHAVKIVMIVRKNPNYDQLHMYDVTIGFPLTVEGLISEVKRK